MNTEYAALMLALIAAIGMSLVLLKHIMFKRDLLKLKEEMKQHHLTHGFDNDLWVLFTERTRDMLKLKR
jgi:hypothetical protein